MEKIILPQLVTCGIYNSQVARKGVKISPNRITTMFEVELPVKNGGRSFIDGEVHPIQTDTLICAKPGQTRHTHFPFMCRYLHIIVNEGAVFDILSGVPNFIKIKNRPYYADIFKRINEYAGTNIEADEMIIQSCLLELVYNIYRDAAESARETGIKKANSPIIEKALQYIENNLSGDLRLKTVSANASLSPVYFHNLFKSATGITLREYVERRRVKRAINYLLSANMTLTEIAYECGFSSQSYFNYAFKRRMKLTPREYAKKINMKYTE